MKTILVSLFLASVALTGSAAKKTPTSADSLATSLGALQGNYLGERIAKEKSGAELDKYRKEFLRGLRDAMHADTVNTGYSDGLSIGGQMLAEIRRMQVAGVPVNIDLFLETLARYCNGDSLSQAESDAMEREVSAKFALVQKYYDRQKEQAQEEQMRELQQQIDKNKAAGEKYIAGLKASDPEYKTTADGLVYKVVKQGDGPVVKSTDRVKVYYTGRLVDGTEFDSTKPGEPTTFHVSQLIKGFTEGLTLMNKGAKYTLVIPYNLAYGEQGPPVIGPAQTLIFDVEVVDILPE